ncbi:PAAR domain-containing protein [Paraburkholderia sp. J63]|uniref:PAAR domain-containing protein n=1 Tax=Paraburkholderia sp. J63 TaxID=2805434 RepID=UPI0039F63A5D
MSDRLVADGDRTSTGGVVFAYSDFLNEEGNAYARKENKATCGNCQGAWPIYGTASDWMDDGEPYVKDGDRALCPCGKNFVFLPPALPTPSIPGAKATHRPRPHRSHLPITSNTC